MSKVVKLREKRKETQELIEHFYAKTNEFVDPAQDYNSISMVPLY